jgi:hypothetical protein
MNEPGANDVNPENAVEHGRNNAASHYAAQSGDHERLAELESENARLHRLVAELLLKNQQLRKSN